MSRGLTEWQRRVAVDFAQAFPLEPVTPIRATGNHLASQNDEPEPIDRGPVTEPAELTEADWIAADLEGNEDKAQKANERNDRAALELQVINLDAMRRAGW